MTYRDNLVVDGVAHAYEFREENLKNEIGENLADGITTRMRTVFNEGEYRPPKEKTMRKVTAEDLYGLYFQESDVDYVVYHGVDIPGWFNNGLSPMEEGLKLREMAPNRVAVYGHVDPIDHDALEDMEHQVVDLGVDGIKFYPASYRNNQYYEIALNDPKTGLPFLEKAREIGLSNIAVHKVIPLETTPTDMVQLDDVDEVAPRFPDINFEIVHAGWSFLEDSLYLLSKHPNVYANLESTHGLLHDHPRQFGKVIGKMIKWAGPEKILFATGSLSHPQPIIEKFWDYEIPADLRADLDLPELTDEMKAQILGTNALRVLGKSPDAVRDELSTDDIDQNRDKDQEPWASFASA